MAATAAMLLVGAAHRRASTAACAGASATVIGAQEQAGHFEGRARGGRRELTDQREQH
jgi:hypothetical protein